MAPRYSKLCKLDSMAAPNDPGSGDIPTMAIDAGRSSRPTGMTALLAASAVTTGFASILGKPACNPASPLSRAGLIHHAGPFFIFGADELAELRRASGHRLGAHSANSVANHRIAQRRHDRGIECGNDIGRGASRSHEPEPADRVVARQSGFRKSRNVRHRRKAIATRYSDHLDLPRLDLRHRTRDIRNAERNVAGYQVLRHRSAAAIRHQRDIEA